MQDTNIGMWNDGYPDARHAPGYPSPPARRLVAVREAHLRSLLWKPWRFGWASLPEEHRSYSALLWSGDEELGVVADKQGYGEGGRMCDKWGPITNWDWVEHR